jgi:glycosyltransferase involved in cell wall biosynthesis
MKILQLAPLLGTIGGTEIFVRRLSEQFHQQGHETVVVTSLPSASPALYDVLPVSEFSVPNGPGEAEVLRIAKEHRPDVVLSHTTRNGRLLTALNALCPTVELIHVFLCLGGKLFRQRNTICTHPVGARCLLDWYAGPCGPEKSPVVALRAHSRTLAHREALQQLPAVMVLTDFMRDYLIGEGLSQERIHVVQSSLGIPPERPTTPLPSPSREAISLLFVGRVVYNKGVQYAVEALTYLDTAYRLTIVGDGFYLQTVKDLAARLGVQDRVEFTGFLQGEALEARYRNADVALVPSIWPEPAGLVVPESRARGLPVVAFAVGGIPEWSARYGYEDIYLAEPASAEALARGIADAACARPPRPPAVTVTPGAAVADILEGVVSRDLSGGRESS